MVLQCVVACYSVLQCVAVCRSVLQCVAECRSVLQCVAVCCSVLQCVAVYQRRRGEEVVLMPCSGDAPREDAPTLRLRGVLE